MTEQKPASEKAQSDAFADLIAAHGPRVARYIRFRIANASDAEDVLQNTLVAAWLSVRSLRNPKQLPAWLMQVAKNRCADYFRSKQRDEIALADEMLQVYSNQFGQRQHRLATSAAEVIEALDTLPESERGAASRFYLAGFSIAEIAADANRPAGTIKRQLFQARSAVRAYLGVEQPSIQLEKDTKMAVADPRDSASTITNPTAFPAVRPKIRITERPEAPFAVDCRELRSWPIIPIVGQAASSADYLLPGWELGEVTTLQALRPAKVHDVDGTEIEVRCWKPDSGWQRPGSLYARLAEKRADFLGVHLPQDDFTQIETFLEETFAWNWGAVERAISDNGLVVRSADGSLRLAGDSAVERGAGIGFGLVTLEIGKNRFTCLRIIEATADGDPSKSQDYITESYLTREGRTLLIRRFCHPSFVERARFPVRVDATDRLVINGIAFHHWYDTITNLAL